jgi:hypothetical protein
MKMFQGSYQIYVCNIKYFHEEVTAHKTLGREVRMK